MPNGGGVCCVCACTRTSGRAAWRQNAVQHSGCRHKTQCLITNKRRFNQGSKCCWIGRLQLSPSLCVYVSVGTRLCSRSIDGARACVGWGFL